MTNIDEPKRHQLDEEGYLILEDVVTDGDLQLLQDAFDRVESETHDAWRQQIENSPKKRPYGLGPTAHVVTPVVQHDDLFVDLLEHPATQLFLMSFLGPDVKMIDNALHSKPAKTPAHTHWHRDAPTWDHEPESWTKEEWSRWSENRGSERPFLKIKVFFFVHDVGDNTGAFSVLPGSHKREVEDTPPAGRLEELAGHVKLTGPAGSVAIWNGRILHTSMDNTDDQARRMLLFNYTHFDMPQYEYCVPDQDLADRIRQQRSPWCRQLMGLERMPL